jgi:hypothetical protein
VTLGRIHNDLNQLLTREGLHYPVDRVVTSPT